MRNWILFMAVLFIAACTPKRDEQAIRKEIAAHKKEIAELNKKVSDLEKELGGMDLTETSAQAVPVEVFEVSYEPFRHYIEVSGSAEAVKEAYISPEVGGQIREIYVNEGDFVEKGRLLARLNTEITESGMEELKAARDLATTVYEKQKRLWEKGIGSEIQYLNAKNSKESLDQKLITMQAQMDMAIIKSPVSGIVDEIYKKKGELAVPGMQLMQVVNLDELYINADISESYLAQIDEGDHVRLEFPVYPDIKLEVPIFRKGNVINPNNRTFMIQLKLKNPDNLLKPNILSVIHINDFTADSAIVVPTALIKQDISGYYVYTMEQNSEKKIARKAYIQTGKSYQDKTMVLDGLEPGQKVISQGFNMVSDGSEVSEHTRDVS